MFINPEATYMDFIATVSIDHERLYKGWGWTYGQTYFNLLRRKCLALAEEIRDTELDPRKLHEISSENHARMEEKWNQHNDTGRSR